MNYTRGTANRPKMRLRHSPYLFKPYQYDPQTSIGPGLPVRICVTGFDSLTPQSQVERLFSSFGEILDIKMAQHPTNGSSLGVCMIKYKDCKSLRGGAPVTAASAAKRAHLECKAGQHRIGQRPVSAALDRDGTVGRQTVQKTVEKLRPRQPQPRIPPPPPPPPQNPEEAS